MIEREGKLVALLPGPAAELYPMMEGTVIPTLRRKLRPLPYGSLTLHTFGKKGSLPESFIDEKIRPVIERKRSLRKDEWLNFCILFHSYRVDVKVEARASSQTRLKRILGSVRDELLRLIGADVYGQDEDTLESVAGKVLRQRKLTLAVAESCTGGLLSEMITRVPGSSDYFLGGFVTYTNDAKQKFLNVSPETLRRYGAVSPQTALEMAQGTRARTHSSVSLSITGIAGPTGGSRQKPVGLVFIGFSNSRRNFVREFKFPGERDDIRHRAAMSALDLLRRELGG